MCASCRASERRWRVLSQEQIYIRTKGYGWIEFKVAFSSAKDKTTGTPEDPLKRLIQITKEEMGRTPPEEPPVMESHIRKVPVLGTLALQAKRFKAESLFSIEDLRARRGEYEAAWVIRWRSREGEGGGEEGEAK
mmetsp:Transcript_37239/g.83444  ORF Transcript_37239/g.83444 Transcript_37239/m.83444 type:complete len:135 (-) Transcript_37239:2602-3006(-)